MVESMPKPVDTLTLGFGFNYAVQPYEFGVSAGNVRVQGIVDHLFTFDFHGEYSFSDRFALGVGIPVHLTRNILSLSNTSMETSMNIGDIMINGLYNFVSPEDNAYNVGFAVAPFVTFPSGRNSDFVGDANVTGGFFLIGDIDLNGHYLGLNVGLRFREEESFLNLNVGSEFLYSAAYHHTVIPMINLDGFVEVNGSTVLTDFFSKEISSPVEAKLGATLGLLEDNKLKITMAHGMGFGNGYGTPDYRVTMKVTYDHLLPRVKKVEVVKVVERIQKVEQELKELTIYYPTDESQVDPFYDQKIAGIAKILKQNPGLSPLYIVGHTDNVGTNRHNQRLSERRAKQAFESILTYGIDADSVVWLGAGEMDPVVDNSNSINRAQNRRTLFSFIKPKQLTEGYKKYGTNYDRTKYKTDSYTEILKEQEKVKEEKTRVKGQSNVIDSQLIDHNTSVEPKETKKKKKRWFKRKDETEQETKKSNLPVEEKVIYEEDVSF